MHVFEITFPGDRPRLASPDESFEVYSTLRPMASHLASAAVSLHLFEQAHVELTAKFSTLMTDHMQLAVEQAAAVDELLAEAELARGAPLGFPERDIARSQLREEGAQRAARKRWATGVWPETYRGGTAFAHAAAFVHVLYVFDQLLSQLVERWKATHPGLTKVEATFDAAIPDLKGVRDSLAHLDERLRKQAKLGGTTYQIEAEDWEISCIVGKTYRMLMIDEKRKDKAKKTVPGRSGTIPITDSTVEAARVALQDAINEFQWDGDRRYEPR